MFAKEEEKQLRIEFWEKFGAFSQDYLSASGQKKWTLYNTKIKGLELKFAASRLYAGAYIEVNHKSEDRRLQIYEAIDSFKAVMQLPGGCSWQLVCATEEGKEVSRIGYTAHGLDYLDRGHWPQIMAFMAEKMMILETNFNEISLPLKEELNSAQ
jgi:hypothetical protein